MDPVIIVGTGIAGYTLAREFRKLDRTTPLLLITADDGCSYPKPLLSNALTKGKTADQIAMFDVSAMATTLACEIFCHKVVTAIDPEAQTITLENNQSLAYKKLVLALGASPHRLSVEGNAGGDVLSINNLVDYTIFRDKLVGANHVTLIGAGLIGCEFANDLANVGINVSVVSPDLYPMSSLLPELIAEQFKTNLAIAGIDWHLGTTVVAINYYDQSYELVLENGDLIKTDLIVSAIGLRPNIGLAKTAGLKTATGILTDRNLQTSHKHIYALGDCAEVAGHSLLYIAPIMSAAKALANSLAGSGTEPVAVNYPAMPVSIKTPSYPLVVALPSHNTSGNWSFEKSPSNSGVKGLFIGNQNDLQGFVLAGDRVSEKQSLAKLLPDVLS